MQRAVLSALIVIEVHAKDVAAKLVEQQVSSINDFEWISQLRLSIYLFCGSVNILDSTAVTPEVGVHCTIILKYCGCRMRY